LTSSDSVATGSFVSVKISVSISGRSLSLSVSSSVRSASLSSASPLPQLSGQLIIGGFSGASPPSTGGRSKRSLPVFPASIWAAMPSGQLSVGGQPTEAAESPYAGVYETSTDDHTYDNLSNNSAKFSSIQLA
uniref:REJ domain-containing protein n=1 Tax=Macrostomum lignano TaxID=282301 RepID=A0A1I8JAJ5_9PLAT